MDLLGSHDLVRHSSIEKVKISLVCYVSDLGWSVNVPTGAFNCFVCCCFVDNSVAWESRVQDGNCLIFGAGEHDGDIRSVPFDFVDLSSMMVCCENIGLFRDVPNLNSTVGRSRCQNTNVGCIQWQTDNGIGMASFFELLAIVTEFLGFFAFGNDLAS